MAFEALKQKKKEIKAPSENINPTELPEEYLRIEYPEDWKYLQKVKSLLDGYYIYYF